MTDARPPHVPPTPLARVRTLTEAFGADPARWPATERALAGAPLTASAGDRAALQSLVAEEAALDRLLAALPAPAEPSPVLRAAILAAAPATRRPERRSAARWLEAMAQRLAEDFAALTGHGLWRWRPAGAVLAGALALGMVSGNLVSGNLVSDRVVSGDGLPVAGAIAWQGGEDGETDLLAAALLDGDPLDSEGEE